MASGWTGTTPMYLAGTELFLKIDGIDNIQEWAINFAQDHESVEDLIKCIGIYETCDIYDSGLIHLVFKKYNDAYTTLNDVRQKLRSYGFKFGSVRIRKTSKNHGQILAHYMNEEETEIYSGNCPKANTSTGDNENNSDEDDCDPQLLEFTEKMKAMFITQKDKSKKVYEKHHEQMEKLLEKQKKDIQHVFDKNRKDIDESLKKAAKKRVKFQ